MSAVETALPVVLCRVCGTSEPEAAFGKHPSGRKQTTCKACIARKARETRQQRKELAAAVPPVAVEPDVAPTVPRRALPHWEERRAVGVTPRPVAGSGPEGEEIVAALWSDHPVALAHASQLGYVVARAGTGEVLNEAAYTVVPVDGYSKLVFMDVVVVIRRKDYNDREEAQELANIRHRLSELPQVTFEDMTTVKTIVSHLTQQEGPPDG